MQVPPPANLLRRHATADLHRPESVQPYSRVTVHLFVSGIRTNVKFSESVVSRMGLRDRRRAGLLLFAGSIGFAIGMTVAEAMYPGYNVAHDFLGDLGVGPSALTFNASILFLGVAFLAAAVFLVRAFRDRLPPIAVAVTGIGAIGFALLPPTEDSPVRMSHTGAALLVYAFGALFAVVEARMLCPP